LFQPWRYVVSQAIDVATLIFAAMAGLGSLIRVYQNRRMYLFQCKVHKKKLEKNA
jgi:hypothetical protein